MTKTQISRFLSHPIIGRAVNLGADNEAVRLLVKARQARRHAGRAMANLSEERDQRERLGPDAHEAGLTMPTAPDRSLSLAERRIREALAHPACPPELHDWLAAATAPK